MTLPVLGLSLLGLAVICVAAELIARALLPRFGGYYVWPPFGRLHMTTDREAVPELEPVVRVEINRDGERGGSVPDDWRDTYRVLVAGGSVVECWFLDQQSAWPQVIERRLNEPDALSRLRVARAHVGSIGRSLVVCAQIDRMLERILPRYERLDAIVFMVGASDLVRWLEQGAPASPGGDDVPLSAIFRQHPEGPFGWTPRTLALRRIASSLRRRWTRRIVRRTNLGRSLARARGIRSRSTQSLRTAPDPAPMLDRFEADFRRLLERARAKAGRVIVARQPWLEKEFTAEEQKRLWMFGVGPNPAGEKTAFYSHDLVWKLMRQVDDRAASVAADLGVEMIDLAPVVPATFDLWYDEMHVNARGCERIGRAIADLIVRGS